MLRLMPYGMTEDVAKQSVQHVLRICCQCQSASSCVSSVLHTISCHSLFLKGTAAAVTIALGKICCHVVPADGHLPQLKTTQSRAIDLARSLVVSVLPVPAGPAGAPPNRYVRAVVRVI